MTTFYVRVSDSVMDDLRVRIPRLGWRIVGELHVDGFEINGLVADVDHWLVEFDAPDAPPEVEGRQIDPMFQRAADGSVTVMSWGVPS